jgi:hypothetical protein
MTEISDNELFERMKAKLRPDIKPKAPGLTDEERRMADRFAGRDNVERVLNAKPGRKVRPVPVVIHFEWYEIPETRDTLASWRVNRVENGRVQAYASGYAQYQLEEELEKLRSSGAFVRQYRVGFASEKPAPKERPVSRKQSIISEIGTFRL